MKTVLTLRLLFAVAFFGLAAVHFGCASNAGDDSQQTGFAASDQAVQALVNALRDNDYDQVKAILGPAADQIISSGDFVVDEQNQQKFLGAYDTKHELTTNPDASLTLTIGNNDWPMPIPIVNKRGKWRFDTQAGLDEILNRRFGRNELSTIQVCLAIVDAQREYVQRNPNGGDIPTYAEKFLSDPGRKNGLYWATADSEQPGPLGPLVAGAAEEGYELPNPTEAIEPYHGYFYRMLKAQSPSALGGACDYVVDGKMIGGFALVAYPASYGNSSIMTFIVNHAGVVYQKDLGPDTASIAAAMTTFDPDSSWHKVESTELLNARSS